MKKLQVLYLCTANSCRSQMAEGWTRALKGDVIDAFSAGILPKGLDPVAVKVMAEIGIDISTQTSKHLDFYAENDFDHIVTVCDSGEQCPIFFNSTPVTHISFDDPPFLTKNMKDEQAVLACYRRVRDEIGEFVRRLPDVLTENIKK